MVLDAVDQHAGGEGIAKGGVLPLVSAVAPPEVKARLDGQTDLDFAMQIGEGSSAQRFRINVFSARGECGACIRAIPGEIPSLETLGFPAELAERIVTLKNGLVLVTGITGSALPDTNKVGQAVKRIKARTELPICVGFGVKTADDEAVVQRASDASAIDSTGMAAAKATCTRRRRLCQRRQ